MDTERAEAWPSEMPWKDWIKVASGKREKTNGRLAVKQGIIVWPSIGGGRLSRSNSGCNVGLKGPVVSSWASGTEMKDISGVIKSPALAAKRGDSGYRHR